MVNYPTCAGSTASLFSIKTLMKTTHQLAEPLRGLNPLKMGKRLETLRKKYSKRELSFDRLAEIDPEFKTLKDLSPGLRLGRALDSLSDNRICSRCSLKLAFVSVCGDCLNTEEGRDLSKTLQYSKAGLTRKSRSPEQKRLTQKKIRKTSLKKYGTVNPRQNKDVIEKAKATCLKRYGVDNPSKVLAIKEKKIKTCRENHGVDHPLHKAEFVDKAKKTWMKNLGVDQPMKNPKIREKSVRTNLRKRGVPYATQSQQVKEKTKRTVERRFGGYPMQNARILEKSRKSRFAIKEVNVLGKDHFVQGYEPQVLKWLESKDLMTRLTSKLTSMPEIWYQDNQGRRRRYFPDFVFQSRSGQIYIAEVKSTFTLMAPDVLPKALAAIEFCKHSAAQFRYAFFVYSKGVVTCIRSTEEFHKLRSNYESH